MPRTRIARRRTTHKPRGAIHKPRTAEALAALVPGAHPLSWYKPGRRVHAKGYTYTLTARPGKGFAPGFRPQVSPGKMLALGVFEGKYLNDCTREFPREWYRAALARGKLSPGKPNPAINAFGIKSRLSLREWKRAGWIRSPDTRGWFQWYCRYWIGRRDPTLDSIQIGRWRAFTRHRGQILASYRRLGRKRPRTPQQKRKHRPKQRQALLQWAYNPYV